METIDIIKLKVSAKTSKSIGGCIRECIQLAATEWRNVELKHNGKFYTINVNDLYGTVEEKTKDEK
jgi:hypothetical protein